MNAGCPLTQSLSVSDDAMIHAAGRRVASPGTVMHRRRRRRRRRAENSRASRRILIL